MSSFAYSALGMDDSESSYAPPNTTSTPSSIALSFAEARSSSTTRTGGSRDPRNFMSSAGGGGIGYQNDSSSESKSGLLSSLRGAGASGLGVSGLANDTTKFRCDKPSRLVRMERGTKLYRFTLLFLSVIIVFSGYFQFDLPAITVDQILPRLHINMQQYATIFVGYSISNTIVPLLSGPFFGKFGKWRGVTVIAITITIGIVIVWLGIVSGSFPVVVIGRTIYGLGGESVFVGVDILVTKWFQGAEIGFAYGLIQAAGQAGSFTALYSVPPLVAAWGDVNQVYFMSVCLSCSALACLALARLIEKTAYGVKKVKGSGLSGDEALLLSYGAKSATDAAAASPAKKGNEKGERASLLGGDAHKLVADGPSDGAPDEEDEQHDEGDVDIESDELKARLAHNLRALRCIPPLYHAALFLGFGHLTSLGWRFYAVMGGIIAYSSAFYTFLAFGPKWLITSYGLSEAAAGQTAGIIAIFSMIVSPSSGLIMDQRGGQRYVCFFAMVSACMWFAIMGFAQAPPALCIVFAGMSYSLLPASLYPLLPEVVPAESFTIVYAVLNSAINLVFSIVLVIAGNVLGQSTTELTRRRILGGLLGALTTIGVEETVSADHPGSNVDPKNFQYVFGMFVVITGLGTIATGSLAYDAWKMGTGWQKLTSHH